MVPGQQKLGPSKGARPLSAQLHSPQTSQPAAQHTVPALLGMPLLHSTGASDGTSAAACGAQSSKASGKSWIIAIIILCQAR
eukprot:scaffold703_cov245-Pinguiococcus_pyrenoidosus.AAC.10